MPAYMIVEMSVTDPAWVAEYRRVVPGMIADLGGRYLALSRSPERIEGAGACPQTLAIIEFPSIEVARSFIASEAYRPFGEARRAGAETTIHLIESLLPPATAG